MDDFGFRLLQLEFAQQNPERFACLHAQLVQARARLTEEKITTSTVARSQDN